MRSAWVGGEGSRDGRVVVGRRTTSSIRSGAPAVRPGSVRSAGTSFAWATAPFDRAGTPEASEEAGLTENGVVGGSTDGIWALNSLPTLTSRCRSSRARPQAGVRAGRRAHAAHPLHLSALVRRVPILLRMPALMTGKIGGLTPVIATAVFAAACGKGSLSAADAGAPDVDGSTLGFLQISFRGDHSCGLRTDGTLACWGVNLSDETVAPPGTFLQVAMGSEHACALRTDGTVTCWGGSVGAPPDQLPAGAFTQLAAG